MKENTTRRAVLKGLTATGAASAVVGTGAAQEGNETQTTETPADQQDDTPGESNLELKISPTTTITAWEYSGGTWRIETDGKTPNLVTVTDASQIARALSEGEGQASGTARMSSYQLDRGRDELRFSGERYDGMAAVTMTASGGERVAVLRTDALSKGYGTVPFSGAAAAIAASVAGTGVFTARKVAEKQAEEREEAERIK
jgi:hypothetical protein